MTGFLWIRLEEVFVNMMGLLGFGLGFWRVLVAFGLGLCALVVVVFIVCFGYGLLWLLCAFGCGYLG